MPEPVYRVRVFQAEADASAAPRQSVRADITDIQDVSVDQRTEKKVNKDREQNSDENLLTDDAPKEL